MIAAPLTGLAVGDALGMPFETAKRDRPDLIAWDGHSYGSSEHHKLGPGQWTDDTQMSMALARTLVNHQQYLPEAAALAYLDWYRNGSPRGMGKTTREAMERLASGIEWHDAGIAGAEGNGTAMRVAPLGAFYRSAPIQVLAEAARDALITHASHEAAEGSRAIALAVAYLCFGEPKEGILTKVVSILQPSKISNLLKNLQEPVAEVPAHVVATVPAAFYAFLSTSNFQDAVERAIRFGGDTDTVAAITGALAGSHYGYHGIPEHYIQGLERADDIVRLDNELFT